MQGDEYDANDFKMPTTPADPPLPSDDDEPTFLRTLNPVPWFDDHVRMDRKRHVYALDGEDLPVSTTGFMKNYVGEFNAEAKSAQIVERMRDYEERRDSGVTRQVPEWLVKQYARYGHCRTAEEIRNEWNITRDKGTFVHRLIELYYNAMLEGDLSRHSALRSPEFQQFLRFNQKHVYERGFTPFRTEFTMFRYEIGGQIDMLYQAIDDAGHPTAKYNLWMVDWKRKFELGPHGEPLRAPFADMPPGDRTKFTIQLNTYKAMIEAATPYRILRMSVLLVHPDMPDFYLEEIEDIQPKIAAMFEERRLALVERKCLTAGDLALLQARQTSNSETRVVALRRAAKLLTQAAELAGPQPPPPSPPPHVSPNPAYACLVDDEIDDVEF